MALGPVASIVASVGIAGTIAIGALSTWHGGSELTAAKNLILQQADSLGVYHTNEGKLLNQVSTLKSEISTLEANNSGDTTQIADLQAQLTTAQNQLTAAQGNGMTLATAVDTQNAAIDQANADADSLNTTVTANATVSTSDQAAVDAAMTDPGTNPATVAPAVPSMPAGDLEVDYATVTMPYAIWTESGAKEVQINVENGNFEIQNVSDTHSYTYSVDGGNTWTTMSIQLTVLGTTAQINNAEVQVKQDTGTIKKFWFINK